VRRDPPGPILLKRMLTTVDYPRYAYVLHHRLHLNSRRMLPSPVYTDRRSSCREHPQDFGREPYG
jgi:hypothetical protein